MSFLILFPENNDGRFDRDKLRRALEQIPSVQNVEEGAFTKSVLRCDFDYDDDRTTLRVGDDLKSIVIDGTGDASLKIAIEIQRQCEFPIRTVDENYNFDLRLTAVSSVEELRKQMDQTSSCLA
jgi:hypothetical protein